MTPNEVPMKPDYDHRVLLAALSLVKKFVTLERRYEKESGLELDDPIKDCVIEAEKFLSHLSTRPSNGDGGRGFESD